MGSCDNVYCLPNGALPTEKVLSAALDEEFAEVIVVGIRREAGDDGEKLWVSSSHPEITRVMWLLRTSERFLSDTLDQVEL